MKENIDHFKMKLEEIPGLNELPKVATEEELIKLGAQKTGEHQFKYENKDLGVIAGWGILEDGTYGRVYYGTTTH